EFDSTCAPIIPAGTGFAATPESGPGKGGTQISATAIATSTGCSGDFYVTNFNLETAAYLDAYGTPPTCFEDPPAEPPEITAQFAAEVNSDGAVVKANINPRFWANTRYYVEYGTGKCSEGGCTATEPLPPGALLTSKVISQAIATSGVFLAGLAAETTYHYRFVAESGFELETPNGPVYGTGDPEEATFASGAEATFTTPPPRPPAKTDCPNQPFRSGAGAYLPDCRAYEMVSPVDKANGDILVLGARDGFPRGMEQAALSGDALAYATYRAFGDQASAPYGSEYLASRGAAGWSTAGINPPREGTSYLTGTQFRLPFKAFSADLAEAWLQQDTAPILEPGAPGGFTNLYRRDNASGAYEALIEAAPANLGAWVFKPEVQGASADGACTVFRANDKLAASGPAAPDLGNVNQLYVKCAGKPLRLASTLPSGSGCSKEKGASAGTANWQSDIDRNSSVSGAVSADGQDIYWTCGAPLAFATGPGDLYLRTNASEAQSPVSGGECTNPLRACTVAVSAGAAQFWQGAADGSAALYSEGAKLFLFDAQAGSSTEVAGQFKGLLGASSDLGRFYFVSEAAFDGAEAGKPNLYLQEGATRRFVGVLAGKDFSTELSPATERPSLHLARVSPDGAHAAFMSTAPLTGYDNADQQTDEADAEVFLYDASADQLVCASCNASGQRPSGRELLVNGSNSGLRAAATIPGYKTQLHAPRVLADDGSRLFFESFEALLPADTNGKADVY
ncbi:MAG TPA: hypothetical protein VFG66_17025, partial [Gemmatimonadales bacterium]|nr:hypothetical protein [Gemmatimonadales bacterium]